MSLNLSERVIPETEKEPQSNSTSRTNLSKCTLHTMTGHVVVMTILVQDNVTHHVLMTNIVVISSANLIQCSNVSIHCKNL